MSGREEVLLDATDVRRRVFQHGAILAGIVVLASAGVIVNAPDSFALAIGAIVLGLVLFILAAVVKQRWQVIHRGHRIRFENNPFVGERLFVDDELVAKGKLGFHSEMRWTIRAGSGAGDRIVARSTAGLLSFRCRITVESGAGSASAVPGDVSDEQLLEEVRRRGLPVDGH